MFAQTVTKLSLADFARIMGINPLHFAQVQLEVFADVHCAQPLLQYDWQDADKVSREQIARAIAEAEAALEQYLGYRLLPAYEVAEVQRIARPNIPRVWNLNGYDMNAYPLAVEATWKKFVAGGVEAFTELEDAASIVWDDANAWGWPPNGTVTIATTVTDACEIAVYYPGHGGEAEWEIRPISVAIAGGSAVVTIARELLVDPDLYAAFDPSAVDGTDDGTFLSSVAVYRRYHDPSSMASMIWERVGLCGCVGGCPSCGYAEQAACLVARDYELSWLSFRPGEWDADDETYATRGFTVGRAPDMIELSYRAGNRDERQSCPTRDMPEDMKRVVAYFAASKLDRTPCDCNPRYFERMAEDLAFRSGITDEGSAQLAVYRIPERDVENPFGTRRGAIEAWRWTQRPGMQVGRGYVRS